MAGVSKPVATRRRMYGTSATTLAGDSTPSDDDLVSLLCCPFWKGSDTFTKAATACTSPVCWACSIKWLWHSQYFGYQSKISNCASWNGYLVEKEENTMVSSGRQIGLHDLMKAPKRRWRCRTYMLKRHWARNCRLATLSAFFLSYINFLKF